MLNRARLILLWMMDQMLAFYQLVLSPILGQRCRFQPTCSAYARQALETHGLIRGILLTGQRLCRCHPWGGHGMDPVPMPKSKARSKDRS